MVVFSTFAAALGLLAFATQSSALPLVQVREDANTSANTIKIMPFGASIVEQTCWRAFLQAKMRNAGMTNTNFVGSLNGPASCTDNGVAVDFDKDHEGHSGALVTDYAKFGNLTAWLASAKPDMVIMHVGTNDAVQHKTVDDILKAYDTLLGQMRTSNPKITLVLSKLIPMDPNKNGAEASDLIKSYNTAMEGWTSKNSKPSSTIILVDNFTGFDVAKMTKEGMHPNEAGDKFMAAHFFDKMKDALVHCSDVAS